MKLNAKQLVRLLADSVDSLRYEREIDDLKVAIDILSISKALLKELRKSQ